jgi:hypothetical protein
LHELDEHVQIAQEVDHIVRIVAQLERLLKVQIVDKFEWELSGDETRAPLLSEQTHVHVEVFFVGKSNAR